MDNTTQILVWIITIIVIIPLAFYLAFFRTHGCVPPPPPIPNGNNNVGIGHHPDTKKPGADD